MILFIGFGIASLLAYLIAKHLKRWWTQFPLGILIAAPVVSVSTAALAYLIFPEYVSDRQAAVMAVQNLLLYAMIITIEIVFMRIWLRKPNNKAAT